MKINILNYEPDRRGGGWTQARYLYEGLDCVPYEEADIILITGPTMASHDEVDKAKTEGKKIVLRCDNAVRNSNNRGTGMPRMKHFAKVADLVIYQSQWAKDFLMPFTGKDGAVILNGVDTNIYNNKDRIAKDDSYLYARSSRDEGKNWIAAWYWFVNNPGTLEIVGKFSLDNIHNNFDFFNGERWTVTGETNDMPNVYKRNKYFLYTYINDASSNTLLEARASGCEIVDVYGALKTGGAPELMALDDYDISVERMLDQYRKALSVVL